MENDVDVLNGGKGARLQLDVVRSLSELRNQDRDCDGSCADAIVWREHPRKHVPATAVQLIRDLRTWVDGVERERKPRVACAPETPHARYVEREGATIERNQPADVQIGSRGLVAIQQIES